MGEYPIVDTFLHTISASHVDQKGEGFAVSSWSESRVQDMALFMSTTQIHSRFHTRSTFSIPLKAFYVSSNQVILSKRHHWRLTIFLKRKGERMKEQKMKEQLLCFWRMSPCQATLVQLFGDTPLSFCLCLFHKMKGCIRGNIISPANVFLRQASVCSTGCPQTFDLPVFEC